MLCTNHARSSFNKNEIHSSLWKLVFYMYTDSSYNTVFLKPIYIKYIKGRCIIALTLTQSQERGRRMICTTF